MLTAKGLSVREDLTFLISALRSSAVKKVEEDSTPRPPASETAATSSALDIHCMQAAIIGYLIPSFSVTNVFISFIAKTSV